MGYRDKPASISSNPNSVRCVAILDADAGEDVDSVLLAHPDDDVSVARVRATKGLILALRGATRTLSGRDATCATLDREADDDADDGTGGGCVRIGMATLPGTGALLAVETTADEDAVAARLAATTAEHIRFLHGDRWIARLRGERDARDANRRGTEDANGADASTSEQKPSSDDLRSTIESFLFGRNNARTAVRIRCTVDPRVRTALATAETATRPLAERVGSDAAPFFADLKPGAVLRLGTSNEEPCRVLASHLPVDVTARLVAHVGSSKSKGGCTFDARGYHARWVWIQKDPEGSRMPSPSTEEAEKAGGAPSSLLERRGLIAATDGVVVVCTLLRPLVDGLEAASELSSRGGFEVRALEEALRKLPDVNVDDDGWTDDGVDGVVSSTEGVDLGGVETMDDDAVTTLAEVFEAQRVDRTRAGDAGGGPSFGRD